MDLISMLTQNLGISDLQAKGGTGLLLDLAKKQLGGDDFSKIASAIPNADSLMENIPQASGLGGMLGGLGGMLGGKAGNLGNLAALAGGFSKLDMDSDMIQKFLPVVMSYLKEQGGSGLDGILEKVMK
jgi:Protein of unknown function VcgC/VcgE (DUF2780)